MGKSRFTEEQIAFALRQAESGTKVSEDAITDVVKETEKLQEEGQKRSSEITRIPVPIPHQHIYLSYNLHLEWFLYRTIT